jgi:GH15 family glucan-1,4-alpha-glucosidase
MPSLIEDYAIIGNCESAAMVGRNGSIDWLAFPRFDSAACFAALLGGPENGRWQIAPIAESRVSRRYREGTLVLETVFQTADGEAVLLTAWVGARGAPIWCESFEASAAGSRCEWSWSSAANTDRSFPGCAGSMTGG